MTVLILGLALFLGSHSVRIFADGWRTQQVARLGENAWKGLFSLIALAGLVLVIWGYAMARAGGVTLWTPPAAARPLAWVLMPVSFVLLAAAYVPGNRIKATLGHPMVLGVKVWAFAHLLANAGAGDVLLFGAFLAWAVLDFRSARARDRAAGTRYPAGSLRGDVITVAVGLAASAAFARYLHGWLIGMPL